LRDALPRAHTPATTPPIFHSSNQVWPELRSNQLSAAESAIGSREKAEQQGKAVETWYVIDRGFVGTLEENSVGEKILWAPVMAWGEFVSLGLSGWMVACATPCQKGWLVIVYDEDERVIRASDRFLPDEHPIVADCARSAVRANVAVCQGVRERVRPSSLPIVGEAKLNGGGADSDDLP